MSHPKQSNQLSPKIRNPSEELILEMLIKDDTGQEFKGTVVVTIKELEEVLKVKKLKLVPF